MLFNTITSALVLASAAVASPLSERAARAGFTGSRRSALKIPYGDADPDDQASVSQSSNWAGAVISPGGVTNVVGTFTIPTPTAPSGGSSSTEFCGAAWVGIDGDTCQSGLIQTGVFWCVESGELSFEAWYEYIPAASIAYSGISVAAGNEIKVTVTKSSSTGGTTTLENVSTGQTVSHTFSNQKSGTLCGDDAEWIVEDFTSGSSLVPFADFHTVTFTGAEYTANGVTSTAGAANTIVLVSSSDKDLTSTSVSGSTVTVTYE
jgi:hypothetical protein